MEVKSKPNSEQRPQLEEIKGAMHIGTLHIPFPLYERLTTHFQHSKDGKFRRDRILKLLEAGLENVASKTATNKLIMLSQSLRSILRAATEIDLVAHPPPPKVDPTWWNEKEQERLDMAREQILRVLHEASRIVGEMGAAEKVLR